MKTIEHKKTDAGKCPKCGYEGIEYGGREIEEEVLLYNFKCPLCGAAGSEIYRIDYSYSIAHELKYDSKLEQAIEMTKAEFESSCSQTLEYLEWHAFFKSELTKFLKSKGATKIEISKPNHFDMSGFFTAKSGQIWWFRIGDLRWSKDKILIRTAQDYKDYSGGVNQYVSLLSVKDFTEEFDVMLK